MNSISSQELMRKLARGRRKSPRWLQPPKHGKSWQIIMLAPGEEQLNALQSPFCSLISLLFLWLLFNCFQWLILFRLYICIYTTHTAAYVCGTYGIYSKTEDQTLAGKRNIIISNEITFLLHLSSSSYFLKALTLCLLAKNKAYFPAEVLPTCTLKRKSHLNEGLLTSRFSFVPLMPNQP